MKKRYKSIILFDLPDERSCLVNLSAIKWSERYKCRKCGNAKNFKGKEGVRQTMDKVQRCGIPYCGHSIQPVKVPAAERVLNVYYASTSKKRISSIEPCRLIANRG